MRKAAQFGCVLITAAIALCPGRALAYSGGPALVEVVGWDKQAQRVYFIEYPPVESGSFYVCYFAPASTMPDEKHVAWEELGDRRSARLDSLRRRSIPLKFRASEVLSGHIEATLQDSVEAQDMRFARFRLNVYYTGSFEGLRFRVLSYGREFVIKDVYKVPGREDLLFVVSFRGNPYGMFEETQVPLLIRKGTWDRVRELVWRPNGAWAEPKPVH